MYYEERIIAGILHFRNLPDGEWIVKTMKAEKYIKDKARLPWTFHKMRSVVSELDAQKALEMKEAEHLSKLKEIGDEIKKFRDSWADTYPTLYVKDGMNLSLEILDNHIHDKD